ncbi:MAG: hypothetical protein RBS09_05960 [Anaerolineaceae bacterium]|jgi:hypothetical protein|nr:hypothetical protein [Anaerolineaceae bacterium]
MKGKIVVWTFLLLLTLILSACVPKTFSPPVEIHITAGDEVEHAVIAVDAAGRSHIAGIVANRIVYYRTRYGEAGPLDKITMTLGGTGTNWKQYNPDIAVLDNGYAYVTWVEQRGGTEKFACYQQIPLVPPIGGYDNDCDPLDGTEQTAGNVMVIAKGGIAYAVYDRPYTDGRTVDLWYRIVSGTPAYAGRVAWFIENFETVDFYSLDLGIDESGFLHVGYHYNWTTGGPAPFDERLELRSNRSTLADGQMDQVWVITTSASTDQDIPVSLSFYQDGTTQRVALASGYHPSTVDQIWVSSCTAVGCTSKADVKVNLPSSWDTLSIIEDVEILGLQDYLYLSFIGDDNTAPTGAEQVYYKFDAFSADPPIQPSSGSATWKYDLEMTPVVARPESAADDFPMMAWGETSITLNEFFVYDGLTQKIKIYDTNCITNLPIGEIASNGIYFSGVWDDCYNTMFSTQAWTEQLPLILK